MPKFYRDSYSGQLWSKATRSPVLRVDFTRGSTPQIVLQDVTDGVSVTPGGTSVYTLSFKVNKADGTTLITAVTGTIAGSTIVFAPTFLSTALDTALGVGDPTRCYGEIKVYDGSTYTSDTEFVAFISGNVNRTGDVSPGVITSGSAITLNGVARLVGGTTTDLDYVPTAPLAAGTGIPYFVRISGNLKAVYLDAGAADASDPNQVAPLDFNGSSNSKHWTIGI